MHPYVTLPWLQKNGTLFRSRSNDFYFNTLDLFFLLIKVDFNLFDYVVIPAKRKQNQKIGISHFVKIYIV